MPRRNRSGDSAPLSFFDGDDGIQTTLAVGTPPASPRGHVGPARTRPAGMTKRKRTNPKKEGPARGTLTPGSKRRTRAQIKHYKELMKKHFGNTHEILEGHASWPRFATFERIEDYIQKVKTEYLNPIWDQKVNHKTKMEEIHSKHVDTAGWDFESIYKRVSSFADENGQENRLTLPKPWASDSGKPYVNVVLAWLFAAKKQLMWTLTVYLKKHKAGDAEAEKFVHESEAGAAARTQFKEFKAKLPTRAPRGPPLKDHAALEHQYVALHPHRKD